MRSMKLLDSLSTMRNRFSRGQKTPTLDQELSRLSADDGSPELRDAFIDAAHRGHLPEYYTPKPIVDFVAKWGQPPPTSVGS